MTINALQPDTARALMSFLHARINEEEIVAAQWPPAELLALVPTRGGMWVDPHGHPIWAPRERVLAEVAAIRAIIVDVREIATALDTEYEGWVALAQAPLRAHAAVYAAHPDYRKEWA